MRDVSKGHGCPNIFTQTLVKKMTTINNSQNKTPILHSNAPFRKISNSAQCGVFALIL